MDEVSYGVIPLYLKEHKWQVLLVNSKHGFWGLPKGHPEEGESPQETASRELFEETHLSILRWFQHEPLIETYTFTKGNALVSKTVRYYLAEVMGEVILQKDEIVDFAWVLLYQAASTVTYPGTSALLREAELNIFKLY